MKEIKVDVVRLKAPKLLFKIAADIFRFFNEPYGQLRGEMVGVSWILF